MWVLAYPCPSLGVGRRREQQPQTPCQLMPSERALPPTFPRDSHEADLSASPPRVAGRCQLAPFFHRGALLIKTLSLRKTHSTPDLWRGELGTTLSERVTATLSTHLKSPSQMGVPGGNPGKLGSATRLWPCRVPPGLTVPNGPLQSLA